MCLGTPARVLSVEGNVAILDMRGVRTQADSSMLAVQPGDYVLVYAGLIVQTLDSKDAEELLRLLAEIASDADA